ncbi:MAG: rhamnogalacturonan lyase [Acidobacteria bacterium]|nr:rhamnogalacturonan lyase [Acidobacteriota bacterium]
MAEAGMRAVLLLATVLALHAERQVERIGRGVVAVTMPDGRAFLSWRLLTSDTSGAEFQVYRHDGGQSTLITDAPLRGATFFVDEGAKQGVSYSVRSDNGESAPVSLSRQHYLSVPLQTLEGYTPNDASVGDLDGDGEYEIVLHQTGVGFDNSLAGVSSEPILEAYKLDGTMLWRINLGKNIREGAHYTQFLVYDFDGDGRAEVACKTADGSVDGTGAVIGDAQADYRNASGYVLSGPEYLTIFDGMTGKALATEEYIPPRGNVSSWGDNYGNRVDRFLAAVAYLDGERPSLVMTRGYYTRAVLVAWNWRDGKLTRLWTFDSDAGDASNRAYRGEGNHNLSVADVDGDGKDEILFGAAAIDDDGKGLYATGIGHGDAMHVYDHDPERPGLEVFHIQEKVSGEGANMRDARTGEVLWSKATVSGNEGPGRGLAVDIDPRHPGSEAWVSGGGIRGLFNAKGERISDRTPSSCNFAIWWDGDLLRELLDRTVITKWNWETSTEQVLLRGEGCESNNGTKATPVLSADLLGDWREEVIWRSADNKELRIYTTTIPTEYRFPSLMQDAQYRLSIAWQNVGYNQPPHPGFRLGGQ